MLTKTQNKYIRSLTQQKYRKEHNVFIAEGDKIAREWLISGAAVQMIVATEDWIDAHARLIGKHPETSLHTVKEHELEQVSALQTPNKVLLVVERPPVEDALPLSEWCLALDGIQDPGNMGTIIRIADWFGINHIVCSPDCVDVYSPKVVQASMGGHLRIKLYEAELEPFIDKVNVPVLAAVLGGSNVYEQMPLPAAVLLIGNESKGIREALIQKASGRVTIPRLGGAESLNAGVSAGILCALLKRS